MIDTTHNDIIRRVEKVEIDVAVIDSKTNRLHQDVKDVDSKVNNVDTKVDDITKMIHQLQLTSQKTNTLVLAVPALLAAIYTIIQIIKNVHIV